MAYLSDPDTDINIPTIHRIRARPPEDALSISIADWDRLMSRVAACKVSVQFRMLAASVAFAVAATAGLSIIPILFSQLPIWVLIAYAATCTFGVGLGIGLVISARSDARRQQSRIDSLLADMEERRTPFANIPPENPEPEVTRP